MKKIILSVLTFFCCFYFAHSVQVTKDQLKTFFANKTYVVQEGTPMAHDIHLKKAIETYWKITTFEFITREQFEVKRTESGASFLFLAEIVMDKDPAGVKYTYLTLAMGDGSGDMTKMPEICTVPVSYSDDKSGDYGYALDAIVQYMQRYAQDMLKNYLLVKVQKMLYYVNNIKKLDGKKVLAIKDDFIESLQDASKLSNTYLSGIQYVTKSEMDQKVGEHPQNTAFMIVISPLDESNSGKCFKLIFDAADGTLYYYNYHQILNSSPTGFNQDDVNKILR